MDFGGLSFWLFKLPAWLPCWRFLRGLLAIRLTRLSLRLEWLAGVLQPVEPRAELHIRVSHFSVRAGFEVEPNSNRNAHHYQGELKNCDRLCLLHTNTPLTLIITAKCAVMKFPPNSLLLRLLRRSADSRFRIHEGKIHEAKTVITNAPGKTGASGRRTRCE
jgi:hypothetical protein